MRTNTLLLLVIAGVVVWLWMQHQRSIGPAAKPHTAQAGAASGY